LQGRVLRIFFQQSKLLIGPCADIGGQSVIIVPKIRVARCCVSWAILEGLRISGFVVGQCAMNPIVQKTGVHIRLKLHVDRLRMTLVKPRVQLGHLLRGERVYPAFNFG